MAADDIAAVHLPPIMPTSDAPPHDSRRGSNEKSRGKNNGKNQNENQDQPGRDPAEPKSRQPQPKIRERKPSHTDIDFEQPEHELDKFA